MRIKEIVNTTTNRGEFNRAYKEDLTHKKNGISCSYCRYNRGENNTSKYYGGLGEELRYPSWKLVSKNRKQWMWKKLKVNVKHIQLDRYKWTEITW